MKNAALVGSGRDRAYQLSAFCLAGALIVGEEEELVLQDGTAEIAAEDVADQFAWTIWETAVKLGLLVEEVVGDRDGRAVVFVDCTMELVGAGLGDEADLRAGGAAGVCVGVAGGDAKLFNRILGLAKHAGKGKAVDLVVVVDTVDGDVALVGAAAVDCAAAAILQGGITRRGEINYTRLQREDIGYVAGFAWECLNRGVVGRAAERGVGGVEGLGLGGDVKDFLGRGDAQGKVNGGRLVDE